MMLKTFFLTQVATATDAVFPTDAVLSGSGPSEWSPRILSTSEAQDALLASTASSTTVGDRMEEEEKDDEYYELSRRGLMAASNRMEYVKQLKGTRTALVTKILTVYIPITYLSLIIASSILSFLGLQNYIIIGVFAAQIPSSLLSIPVYILALRHGKGSIFTYSVLMAIFNPVTIHLLLSPLMYLTLSCGTEEGNNCLAYVTLVQWLTACLYYVLHVLHYVFVILLPAIELKW